MRTRTNTPALYGGLACEGLPVENQPCNTQECPSALDNMVLTISVYFSLN